MVSCMIVGCIAGMIIGLLLDLFFKKLARLICGKPKAERAVDKLLDIMQKEIKRR